MSQLTRPKRHPWVEDLMWHQHAFHCSKWRWSPERPQKAAVRWMGGRELFRTPADYAFLEQRLADAYLHNSQAQEAIGFRLLRAQQEMPAEDFQDALPLLGWDAKDVSFMTWRAQLLHLDAIRDARGSEWEQTLEGLPVYNLLIAAWEIRQLREFYSAYEHLLEDALADLTAELLPRYGWEGLSHLRPPLDDGNCTPDGLRERFKRQREARGEPGDPRRIAKTARTCQRPGGIPTLGKVNFWTWL